MTALIPQPRAEVAPGAVHVPGWLDDEEHQDKDERGLAPVVSLTLGDTWVFRFGTTVSRNRPWTDVELESGDLFVFGGESRLAFHGVPKTLPGTAPPGLGLRGRLNVTLRESGVESAG